MQNIFPKAGKKHSCLDFCFGARAPMSTSKNRASGTREEKGGCGDLCEGLVENPGAQQLLILGILYLFLAGRMTHLNTKQGTVYLNKTMDKNRNLQNQNNKNCNLFQIRINVKSAMKVP